MKECLTDQELIIVGISIGALGFLVAAMVFEIVISAMAHAMTSIQYDLIPLLKKTFNKINKTKTRKGICYYIKYGIYSNPK